MTEEELVTEVVRSFDAELCKSWRHRHPYPFYVPATNVVMLTTFYDDQKYKLCQSCCKYWENEIAKTEPIND